MERRQASGDLRHDGVPGALGAAVELAGSGAHLSDQVGHGVPVRGVVRRMGPAQRDVRKVESIGVDEIHWGHGLRADNFLTVIYQIDAGYRRILWVARRRAEAALRRGLQTFGPGFAKGLRFVCSDMWKPSLKVIAAEASQALHVLDRFHITSHLNQAVDEVRRAKSARLRSGASSKRLINTAISK